MTKYIIRKRIISAMLTIWFVSTLTILTGCKKKDQPEEARQAAPTEETKRVSASEKIDLSILYAGLLETDRAKDFVAFLGEHFEMVETTEYMTFKGNESADFDVTIIDDDGLESVVRGPNISRQYTGATVTMGVPGAFICSNLSLKTGYL
jgi:hypothetical protein